jgi:hypothetical protein
MLKKLIFILALPCLLTINKSYAQQPISPLFFGLNAWMPDSTGGRFLNGPLHKRWNDVRSTRAQAVRYGGISFDRDKPTNHQYLKMVDSIQSLGMEPIIQVSYWKGRYSPQQAAALVKYLNVDKKRNIKYWSIGNEPDHNTTYGFTSASQVAPYVKAFASAMKDADPSIKIIAPDCAWYNKNILIPLTTPGGPHDVTGKNSKGRYYVDFLSFHQYPFKGQQTRAQVISELRAPGKFRDRLREMNGRLENCNKAHGRTGSLKAKIAVTEANVGYGNPSGDNIYGVGTNSFVGGQFWAEMMAIALSEGVSFINFWGVTQNLGILDGNFNRRPNFYHFQMMAQNFSGNFYNGNSNQSNVKAFGSKSSSQISVMILNQSTSSNHNFTLKLNNESIAGNSSLKINVNTGVNKEFSGTIQNQSTTLLIFDLDGNLMRQCEYKLIGHASKNLPPSCKNFETGPRIAANGPTDFCENSGVELSTVHVSGNSYQWMKDGNKIQGGNAAKYTAKSSGEYWVEITNASNKKLSNKIKVEAIVFTASQTKHGEIGICAGETYKLIANTNSGFSYQWKRNSVDIPGATNSTYTADQQGSYRVAVTFKGCTKISENAFITTANPVTTIKASGATTYCKDDSVLLSATSNSAYSYQWKLDNINLPGAIKSSQYAKKAGKYSVEIKEKNCIRTSENIETFTTTINAKTTLSGSYAFCTGDSAILTASASTTPEHIQWKFNGKPMPNLTGKSIAATKDGNYQVAITAKGCTEHSPIQKITVLQKPIAQLIALGQPWVCENSDDLILETSNVKGDYYQWFIDGQPLSGTQSNSLLVKIPGKYTVTISNMCGSDVSNELEVDHCTLGGISNQDDEDEHFTIYPNPTNGQINLEVLTQLNGNEPMKIEIINSLGQVIQSFNANSNYEITREKIQLSSDYVDGMYILSITSGDKRISKPFILKR